MPLITQRRCIVSQCITIKDHAQTLLQTITRPAQLYSECARYVLSKTRASSALSDTNDESAARERRLKYRIVRI